MADLIFSGGLNQQDVATVKLEECIEGYNYELGFSNTSFSPRAPIDSIATTTNTSDIRGIMQLIKRDGTETTPSLPDLQALDEWRDVIPEYVKDYVSLNQFAA